jgi:two-component system OmpR family sensor kinase
MRPSTFRGRLAFRLGAAALAVLLLGAFVAYRALRDLLYDELDRTLLRLAAIEAAAAADSPDPDVHFHDAVFLAAGPSAEPGLERYAEVWTVAGEPVIRTRNLGRVDLPLDEDLLRAVVRSERPSLRRVEWRGQNYRSVLYPLGLVGSQHEPHVLQVMASARPTEVLLAGFRRRFALIVLGGTLAAVTLGWWIAGASVRPITRIVEQAESIEMRGSGAHEIQARADVEEFRRLVEVLNSMLGRIDAAFESQRRFLADVGHEIRTPLTVLRGEIEVALRRPRSAEEYERVLRQSLADLKSASALANDLLVLARGESVALEPARMALKADESLREVAEAHMGRAARKGVRLEVTAVAPITVRADPELLRRALGNLVENALLYGSEGGSVELSCDSDPDGVEFRVVDHGPGIPLAERARVFDRFFRGAAGRRAARGAGLGLAIAAAIAEGHGGGVVLEETRDGGATLVLRIPGASDAESEPGVSLPEAG